MIYISILNPNEAIIRITSHKSLPIIQAFTYTSLVINILPTKQPMNINTFTLIYVHVYFYKQPTLPYYLCISFSMTLYIYQMSMLFLSYYNCNITFVNKQHIYLCKSKYIDQITTPFFCLLQKSIKKRLSEI